MQGFHALKHPRYWVKIGAIAVWGLVIFAYIEFFSCLGGDDPDIEEASVRKIVSFLIAGAGFCYLGKLYDVPYERFSMQPLLSVLMIILGVTGILVGLGIFEAQETSLFWQMVGAAYTIFCFGCFMYGLSQDKLEIPRKQKHCNDGSPCICFCRSGG